MGHLHKSVAQAHGFSKPGDWDLRTNPESRGAALAIWTFQSLDFPDPEDVEPSTVAESFAETVRTLKKAHGRIDVPWSEVNRLR